MPCVCQKFSTFQLSQYFDIDQILTVENCPKILPTFDSQKFCKNKSKVLPKDQNIPENVKNSGTFLAFRQYLSKICSYFLTFLTNVSKKYSKYALKATKWPKFDQKCLKLYRNFRHFNRWLGLLAFWLVSKMYRNFWHLIFAKGSIISQKCTKVRKSCRNAWP